MIEMGGGQVFTLIGRGIFFFLLLIFVVYSSLMVYHWFAYGMSKNTSARALVLYLSVAAICFLVMGLSLLNFT